ncbi:MAG: MFS transporter [Anaerolineales bacterium]|nr:MFS transporter [Anaerolineales bacterium]
MRLDSLLNLEKDNWKRTLVIIFFAQLTSAVGFSTIFPFLPLYVAELGSTTGLKLEFLAGAVFSAQALTMMLTSPFWGVLADRYGRKVMVVRANAGGAISILLMAFAQSAEQLVLLRALQGMLSGVISANNALVASVAPRRHTGLAMGLLQVGSGVGFALGPLLGGMIADWYGYRTVFYVTAGLLLFSVLLVLVGVYEEKDPEEKSSQRVHFLQVWKQAFNRTGVPAAYTLRFLASLGRMLLVPIIPLFIVSLSALSMSENTFTGLVVGVSSATTTVSAIFLGRLADRVGSRKVVLVCAMLTSLLFIPQFFITEGWQILLLQALVGIGVGGITPGISALLAGLSLHGEEGAAFGLDNAIDAGGRMVAPLVGSAVAVWFSLRAVFLANGVIYLLAGVLTGWLLLKQKGNGSRRRVSAPQG